MVVMTFYIMLFCIQLLQLYITGLHKMVTGKRIVNMGSQTCTCIVTFCKLIATAMVLSQEGLKFWPESPQTKTLYEKEHL